MEELTDLVYRRRRELYDAIDRLKAAEGKERRIKSRLMYSTPHAERRSGTPHDAHLRGCVGCRERVHFY